MNDAQCDEAFEDAKPLAAMMCKLIRSMSTPDIAIVAVCIVMADIVTNLSLEDGATIEDVIDGFGKSVLDLAEQFTSMRNEKQS